MHDGSAFFSIHGVLVSTTESLVFFFTTGHIYGYPRRLRLWLSNNCW